MWTTTPASDQTNNGGFQPSTAEDVAFDTEVRGEKRKALGKSEVSEDNDDNTIIKLVGGLHEWRLRLLTFQRSSPLAMWLSRYPPLSPSLPELPSMFLARSGTHWLC